MKKPKKREFLDFIAIKNLFVSIDPAAVILKNGKIRGTFEIPHEIINEEIRKITQCARGEFKEIGIVAIGTEVKISCQYGNNAEKIALISENHAEICVEDGWLKAYQEEKNGSYTVHFLLEIVVGCLFDQRTNHCEVHI